MGLLVRELFIITLIPHLSMLLYSRLPVKGMFVEFICYSVPQLLVVSHIYLYLYVYFFLIFLIILFSIGRSKDTTQMFSDGRITIKNSNIIDYIEQTNGANKILSNDKDNIKKSSIVENIDRSKDTTQMLSDKRTTIKNSNIIDRLRIHIMFLVSIAIFLSDFFNYNSDKMGKGMEYGLKLMDIGVGCFVFNIGLISSKLTKKKKISGIIKSLVFGAIRYISKIYFGVAVSEAEFGKHFNFFFILAILNFLSLFINISNGHIIGLCCIAVHQIALKYFLAELIFHNKRETIFMANLEGIVYVLPQFGVFLIA